MRAILYRSSATWDRPTRSLARLPTPSSRCRSSIRRPDRTDLLGKFYLEPEEDIGLFITEKIQTLPGVKDTYTLITFNAFSSGRG